MNFTIDKSKWRCGGDGQVGPHVLGEGETFLLNEQGYMCCLGQCMVHEGIAIDKLLNVTIPGGLTVDSIFNSDKALTTSAININDDAFLSEEQRIDELTKLFNKHGHQIQFV